jgi:hypothetical protein
LVYFLSRDVLIAHVFFPTSQTKGLRSNRRNSPYIFQVVASLPAESLKIIFFKLFLKSICIIKSIMYKISRGKLCAREILQISHNKKSRPTSNCLVLWQFIKHLSNLHAMQFKLRFKPYIFVRKPFLEWFWKNNPAVTTFLIILRWRYQETPSWPY